MDEEIPLTLMDTENRSTTAVGNVRVWTKREASVKAATWGGIILAVAVLMLPIPIVHFGAIPLVLIAFPLVTFFVYRMHAGARDITAKAPCPACGKEQALRLTSEQWPLHRICAECRASYSITGRR